jgi:TonB family protein
MKLPFALIALLWLPTLARADKPVAYDHITKAGATVDAIVNAALGGKYTILPIEDSPAYTDAKALAGTMPRFARADSGEVLKGYVLVAYVVTAEGRAADPVVLKSTDERLGAIALKAMGDWRFTPARLNGTPIATTAAQEFKFQDDGPPKGFATANLVLYQPNNVLTQRLTDAAPLAAYIKELQTILGDYFAGATTPETFQTVVIVQPDKTARVWFISSRRPGNTPECTALRQKLEAVAPVDVRGGPVAFAISGKLAGGDSTQPTAGKGFQLPIPQEWRDAAKTLKTPAPMNDDYWNAMWAARQ